MKNGLNGKEPKLMSVVNCTHCGPAVPARSRFCPDCGRPLEDAVPASADTPPTRRVWAPGGGLAGLQAEKSRGYHELGRAGYARDREAVQAARSHPDDVNARITAKNAE